MTLVSCPWCQYSALLQQLSVSPQICQCWQPAFCTWAPASAKWETCPEKERWACTSTVKVQMLIMCLCIKSSTTHRPSEDNRSRMKVDFHYVTLRNDLHTWYLSLGQHLIDEVIPRDVATAGINGVQQAHDESYDEEGPQAFPIHLVVLITTFLLVWKVRWIMKG